MPEKKTIERAKQAKHEGKAPSTQAGEFVREEIHHVREGKHGARSPEQVIAIGLSKARKAGVKVPPKGAKKTASKKKTATRPSPRRSAGVKRALGREGRGSASRSALAKHARSAAKQRTAADRSESARKAARTKGAKGRSEAAHEAAETRAEKTAAP